MSTPAKAILRPMLLAGLLTLLAVGYSLRFIAAGQRPLAILLLLVFLGAFVGLQLLRERRSLVGHLLLLAMPAIALAMNGLAHQAGTTQILLVIWAACVASPWPVRLAVPALLLVNAVFYVLLRHLGVTAAPLSMVLINLGFQALAAICVYYARSAEAARDALTRVNADLLATRALLADSARDAERLRVARELHDVAGHKLTAMRLNLRALASDPALAGRAEVALGERLAGELLSDIRKVVQALRDDRGLDLETALHALAAPFACPALRFVMAPDVRITNPAIAEIVLRLAQEALTNTARHAGAQHVWMRIDSDGRAGLRIEIHDDGRCALPIREGNGIAGMRERLAALHGSLDIGRTPEGGLSLQARLPA